MNIGINRITGLLTACAFVALAGCSGPSLDVSLNLVTTSCVNADALSTAQQITISVYGPDLAAPIKTTAGIADMKASVPSIPLGTGRNIVVEAFDSTGTCPSSTCKLVARGETGPVTIQSGSPTTFTIFVRAADQFSYVNSSDVPGTCDALGTGSTTPGRAAHTATVLDNGTVLIAGGYYVDSTGKPTSYLSSTEIFDPTTGHITAGPDLAPGRAFHTATHIPGTPYTVIAGGETATQVLAQAEVYDETQNKFTNAIMMRASTGRTRHTAVLVPTNTGPQVLLIGGFTGTGTPSTMSPPAMTLLSSGEIFNPGSTTFVDAGFKIPNGLAEAGAAVTNTGRVIVLGGVTNPNVSMSLTPNLNGYFLSATASGAYDLKPGLSPKNPHLFPLIGTMGNGSEAMIAGGFQVQGEPPSGASAATEFFNGISISLTAGPALSDARGWGDGAVLPDGSMILSGGLTSTGSASKTADHMLLNLSMSTPSLTKVSPVGQPIQGRYLHRMTVLPDGGVLVTGGINFSASNAYQMVTKLEIYEPPYVAAGNDPHSNVQSSSTMQ